MRRRWPSFGKDYHPSPTGDRKGRQIGRTPFRRCINCGFVNDTRSTGYSDSHDGTIQKITVSVSGVPSVADYTTTEPLPNGFCKFCRSPHWQHSKPARLPDDRDLPSSEWYVRRRRKR